MDIITIDPRNSEQIKRQRARDKYRLARREQQEETLTAKLHRREALMIPAGVLLVFSAPCALMTYQQKQWMLMTICLVAAVLSGVLLYAQDRRWRTKLSGRVDQIRDEIGTLKERVRRLRWLPQSECQALLKLCQELPDVEQARQKVLSLHRPFTVGEYEDIVQSAPLIRRHCHEKQQREDAQAACRQLYQVPA